MLSVDGGAVLVTVVEVTVVVAVVAGKVGADGAALGSGGASFDEQAPSARTRRSAPTTTVWRLTTGDSITPGTGVSEEPSVGFRRERPWRAGRRVGNPARHRRD